MNVVRVLAISALLAAGSSSAVHAQAGQRTRTTRPVSNAQVKNADLPPLTEARPGLQTRAAVKVDAATRTAMNTMPAARITARRIEEHGADLVYVFKLRSGSHNRELWINAATGAVIPTTKKAAGKGG